MPYQILESDENPVWVPDGPMRVTDPVVVPFDHPDIATGVDLGFVGSATVYPVSVFLNVTEAFDSAAGSINDQDDREVWAGGYGNTIDFQEVGPISEAISCSSDSSNPTPTITTLALEVSNAPTQGSVTVRVLYCDLSTL